MYRFEWYKWRKLYFFVRAYEKGRLDMISYIIEKYPKLKYNDEEDKKFNIDK